VKASLKFVVIGSLGLLASVLVPEAAAQNPKCKKVVTAVDFDWVSSPEFEQCAADGDADAEALLGMMYWAASEDGGWPEEYGFDPDLTVEELRARGFASLESAAEKGQAAAMNEIGLAYLDAEYGFERDAAAAHEWLTRGSDAGDVIAPYNLARIYVQGIGVPPSAETAERFLRLSAERNYRPATCSLRVLLEQRLSFPSAIHQTYYAIARGFQPDAQCWPFEIMPELRETATLAGAD